MDSIELSASALGEEGREAARHLIYIAEEALPPGQPDRSEARLGMVGVELSTGVACWEVLEDVALRGHLEVPPSIDPPRNPSTIASLSMAAY